MEVYSDQKRLLVEGSSRVITSLIKRVLQVRQELTETEAEAQKQRLDLRIASTQDSALTAIPQIQTKLI